MAASSLQFESVCEDDSDKVGFEPLLDLYTKKDRLFSLDFYAWESFRASPMRAIAREIESE